MLPQNPSGLTSAQAETLLNRFGKNEIVEQKKYTHWQVFASQFKNIIVWLLIAAAVVSFILGENLDGSMILAIVILNALFGYVQEYKAEQAIEALKKMTIARTRVTRDGLEQHIDSALLVPGDIIILEQGDRVPADGVIVEARNVEVNESILTGESIPVEKNLHNENQQAFFMGTMMARGRAVARVTTTGMNTRFGTIAASLSTIESEETPLEKKIARLGKTLGILGMSSSVILFLIGLVRNHPIFELLLTSISMAVAAVPEGLPAVITITLAIGTQRMAKKRAILRKLSAIEALGSITVIATDKTGTLTKNEMRVTSWWLDGKHYSDHHGLHSPLLEKMLVIASRCNNASLVHNNTSPQILGDPTEGALLLFAVSVGKDLDELKDGGSLTQEFEFDPTIKAMSVLWKLPQIESYQILTKGAPEVVLAKSTHYQTQNGVVPLTEELKKNIQAAFISFAEEGLRVIAFGLRETKDANKKREDAEKNLTFVGFVGISDPPRMEVKAAIEKAQAAGVRTIMITGDNPITARVIGHAVGLSAKHSPAITGDEFSELTDQQAMEILKTTNIYARISPEEKLRIVTLLRKMGHIVGVTGDGVNDALALKQADVGVAMGITGSDVAKGAADMIITDDNYSTIVSAIEEGRTIYENMKSSIKYLLGCNIGEVLSIIIGTLIGWPIILTPLQILFINLVTDGLPALGLAVVPAGRSIMNRKPNAAHALFTKHDTRWLIETSILSTAVMLAAFAVGMMAGDITLARTLAFTASIVVQQFFYLDLQARNQSILTTLHPKNLLPLIGIIPILIQGVILYIPIFQQIFAVVPLSTNLLIIAMGIPTIALVVSELRKRLLKSWYYPLHKGGTHA